MIDLQSRSYDPQKVAHEVLGGDFSEVKGRRIGASHSGHGVIFGNFKGTDVALKPFVGRHPRQRAEHESRLMGIVQKVGLRTLDPLRPTSVFTDDRERWATLLTHYESELLGGNALSLEVDPSTEHGQQIGRLMGCAALTLAELHTELITHGDPQAKNFGFMAINGAAQEPVIFDLEKGTTHGKKGVERGHFQAATKRDLTRLTYSLGAQGYGGPDEFLALQHMQDSVLDPYVAGLEGHARSVLDVASLYTHASGNFAMTRLRNMEHNNQQQPPQINQAV